ncbi:apolipo protein O-domain-containing protein [Xylariales sp. PMI_506]|nr:apolipo protein O-domain-containing protein [Xylariales sp. PMI_506]
MTDNGLAQRAAAPFMAATLVGGALIPSVALAEGPEDSSKKPIYDDYEPPLPITASPTPSPFSETIPASPAPSSASPLSESEPSSQKGPTPTDRLAVQIGKARLFLYHQATSAEDAVNGAMDRAFHLEKSFTETVASLAPPRESGEKLMPGLVYVLVAGMAGSIVSRNRSIVLRATLPLAVGVGAAWFLLPVTMTNVSGLLWKYEQRFPAVAEAHVRTRQNIAKGWDMAKLHSEISRQYVDDKVTSARDVVEGWVRKGN